ncbi:MAG: hypothetical protein HPY50_17510 [Firmicutes bacterium]|nr:hypothetical protein [Bacillota bacterium]
MSLLLIAGLVVFFTEIIRWPWESKTQKNVVRVILTISLYLFWRGAFD